MATRLTFLCAAATPSSRTAAFPSADEPLDDGGRRRAAAFDRGHLAADVVVSSPSRSAVDTAAALGLEARIEPCVADLDFGAWAGRSIADIEHRAPDRLREWFADPAQATPGGEAMDRLVARIGPWIDRQAGEGLATLVVSHASAMRAALAHLMAIPLAAAMRVDIPPLAMLTFSHHGQWRLQELRRPR